MGSGDGLARAQTAWKGGGGLDKVRQVPLCVDLDGTLLAGDLLVLSLQALARNSLFLFFASLPWMLRGKAAFKQRIAGQVKTDPASLPYRRPVLDWVRSEAQKGRRTILSTGADRSGAVAIAECLGCFTEVIAGDRTTNLVGEAKARILVSRFGRAGFDYAGNSWRDLPVWRQARRAIVVSDDKALIRKVREAALLDRAFSAS